MEPHVYRFGVYKYISLYATSRGSRPSSCGARSGSRGSATCGTASRREPSSRLAEAAQSPASMPFPCHFQRISIGFQSNFTHFHSISKGLQRDFHSKSFKVVLEVKLPFIFTFTSALLYLGLVAPGVRVLKAAAHGARFGAGARCGTAKQRRKGHRPKGFSEASRQE